MDKVVVYGRPECVWCDRAKSLLMRNRVNWDYFDVYDNNRLRQELIERGHTTLPTVYLRGLDGVYLGGYEALKVWVEKQTNVHH